PPRSTPFPYTTLFRSGLGVRVLVGGAWGFACDRRLSNEGATGAAQRSVAFAQAAPGVHERTLGPVPPAGGTYESRVERDPIEVPDRKSTRLNSSHGSI